MSTPLKVLLITDSKDDADCLSCELSDGGYEPWIVMAKSADDMRHQLAEGGYDLVLADYGLPQFGGRLALNVYRSSGLDIPFIILCGTESETAAAEAMFHGAHDCVTRDRRGRLVPAIVRELRESRMRLEKTIGEARFRELYENMVQGIIYFDTFGRIVSANPAAERILGISLDKMLNKTPFDPCWRWIREDGSEFPVEAHPTVVALRTGNPVSDVLVGVFHPEYRSHRWVLVNAVPQCNVSGASPSLVYLTFTDITERKHAEEALRESEERYRNLYEFSPLAYQLLNGEGRIIDVNQAWLDVLEYERDEVIGSSLQEFLAPESIDGFIDRLRFFLSAGKCHTELQMVRKNGRKLIMALDARVGHNRQGAAKQMHCILYDITDQKRAEEERERAIDVLRLCNPVVSRRNLLKMVVRYLKEITGCEAVAVRLAEGDDYPYFETVGLADEFIRDEDSVRARNSAGEPVVDETGRPVYGCMCGRVVSGQADQSQPFFTAKGSFWTNCVSHLATQGNGPYLEPICASCLRHGYQSVALIPLRWHGETFGLIQFNDRRSNRFTGQTIASLENLLEYVAVAVSKLKTEEALRESEERYRSIFENAREGIFRMNPSGQFLDLNPALVHMAGFTSADEMIRHVNRYGDLYVDGQDRLEVKRRIRETGVVEGFEALVRRKNEEQMWVSINEHAVNGPGGEVLYYEGTIENVTHRKAVEDALRESELRYRTVTEHSMDGIAVISDGRCIYANRRLCDIFGYDEPEEITGKPITILAHPDEAKGLAAVSRRRKKEPASSPIQEVRGLRRDGKTIYVEVSSAAISFGNRPTVVVYFRDVTQRRKLEDDLRQTQKLEAVGQLAGGVAHDFNNILTVIIGFAKVLEMTIEPADPSMVYVNQIISSAEKAANLIQSLLVFSRKQAISASPSDLNRILEDMEKILSRLVTEDIELRINLCEGELISSVDENQIDQVVINLVANARDAMPDGGVLTIQTEQVFIDEEFMKFHGFGQPGAYALVSFSDTGTGMDKRIQERIFEPFFTTKEIGKGTGLGLSTVYGIVTQHHGYCCVESEPGCGARFDVYLPLSRAGAAETGAQVESRRGRETILLVEDENNVRGYLRAVLERHGYTVLEARNGRDAIRHGSASKGQIDLHIVDVTMPKMNGEDLFVRLQKVNPGVRTLFVAGYTQDILGQTEIADWGLNLISKPIRPGELLRKVREILDRRWPEGTAKKTMDGS